MAKERIRTIQTPNTEPNDWREDYLKELGAKNVIAVESLGVLTKEDIDTAMSAIHECEQQRSEDEEWKLIKEKQLERAKRLFGGNHS